MSETKHEYLAGVVYAMAGTSVDHDRIAVNILGELRGHPYEAFSSDVKVRIESMGSRFYYYPDVTVDCSNVRGDSLFAAVNGASAVNLEPGENGGRREQLTPNSKTCVGDGPDYPHGVRP